MKIQGIRGLLDCVRAENYQEVREQEHIRTRTSYIRLCLCQPASINSRLAQVRGGELDGLTNLIVKHPAMLPRFNPKRARLVINKIDGILA